MPESNRKPICPRCGYDFTGTVVTWTTSCPLDGRCTECGYELNWSEVFVASEHPWLFEYHWRRNPIRRLVLTILNALRPRRFWGSVRLTDPVYLRPAMIIGAVCLLLGLTAVVVSETHGRNSINSMWFSGAPSSTGLRYWLELIWEVILDLPRRLFDRVPGLAVVLFTMPLLFVMVPVTLRRAKVRGAHVLRIWMYSLAWPACVGALWLGCELLTEIFDWYAVNRIMDPWEWIPYADAYANWRMLLLYDWLPGTAVLTIACVWMGVWWVTACRQYLCIERPGRFVALLTIVLWLLAFTVEIYAQS